MNGTETQQIHKCMASDGKDDSGESISCTNDAEWKMTAVDFEMKRIEPTKIMSRQVDSTVYYVCNEHFESPEIRMQLLMRHFKLNAVELKENGRTEVIAAPSI